LRVKNSKTVNENGKKTFNKKFKFMNDKGSKENNNQNNIVCQLDKDNFDKPKIASKKFKVDDKLTFFMPKELQYILASYLNPSDLVFKIQLLSKKWKAFANNQIVWDIQDKLSRLPLGIRLKKVKILVERRSKGKLFIVIDRISGEEGTLRKVFLDVTNAG